VLFRAYEEPGELLGTETWIPDLLLQSETFTVQGAVYPQGKFPCPKDLSGTVQISAACTLTLLSAEPAFGRNYRLQAGRSMPRTGGNRTQLHASTLGVRWEYYGVQHNANPTLTQTSSWAREPIFDQIRNGSVELAKD